MQLQCRKACTRAESCCSHLAVGSWESPAAPHRHPENEEDIAVPLAAQPGQWELEQLCWSWGRAAGR